MNPYYRAIVFVIRLVAFGFILVGAIQLASAAFFVVGNADLPVGKMVLYSIPILLGIVLLMRSGAVAEWISEMLED